MKKFYAVVSTIYDNGTLTANIITENANEKPDDAFKSLRDRDIYVDYFDNLNDAKLFLHDLINTKE